jgi:hypothetical protein
VVVRAAQDEGADALTALHQPFTFEIAIGLEHGVRVDRQRPDDFLHGRQSVAGTQNAAEQCLTHLFDELDIRRHVRAGAEVEADHCVPTYLGD